MASYLFTVLVSLIFLAFCTAAAYTAKFRSVLMLCRAMFIISVISTVISILTDCTTVSYISIGILIVIFAMSMISGRWSCPICGRRYGIRIWFMNRCPHCGHELSKLTNEE